MIVNKYANGNGGGGGTGSTITVDAALSSSSTNPVENRVITNALSEYATEAYVDNAITAATEDLASTQYVDDAIAGIVIPEPPADYATTGDVADAVAGLASETYVDDAISTATEHMVTTDDLQDYATEQYVDDAVNGLAQGIGMLGMVNDVSESNGTVTVMKTTMQEGQLVTGSTSFDIVTSVDSALSTGSTNPVENRVIYGALYGESASTQMEIVESATTSVYLETRGSGNFYFKETNLPGYLAINLGENITGDTSFRRIDTGTRKYFADAYGGNITNATLGVKCPVGPNGSDLWFSSSNLDGTYNYYMVYNQVDDYVVVYKNLPVITEVTDHAANISDIPVAQDGSDFKKFVYFNTNNNQGFVMSDLDGYDSFRIGTNQTDSKPVVYIQKNYWGNLQSFANTPIALPYGNEVIGGAKTAKDSIIIDKAEQALSGLTETITLTLGSASTDTIRLNWNTVQLFETDNPRYLVAELTPNAFNYIQSSTIGGTNYIIRNSNYGATSNNFDYRGVYQLVVKGTEEPTFVLNCQNLATQNYIIIDKELLTIEVAESLTFTRAKNIPQAISAATQNFVTSGDVTTIVDAAVATAITIDSALSTGSTNPVENRVITNALGNFVQSTSVKTIVSCTQAEYDNMQSHDPNTFYIITGVNS